VEAAVDDEDDAEALCKADGAILDFALAEIDAETPRERFMPRTRLSPVGFRVSVSQDGSMPKLTLADEVEANAARKQAVVDVKRILNVINSYSESTKNDSYS
jgi:hypothetical protein